MDARGGAAHIGALSIEESRDEDTRGSACSAYTFDRFNERDRSASWRRRRRWLARRWRLARWWRWLAWRLGSWRLGSRRLGPQPCQLRVRILSGLLRRLWRLRRLLSLCLWIWIPGLLRPSVSLCRISIPIRRISIPLRWL